VTGDGGRVTPGFRRDEIAITIPKRQAMRGFCGLAFKLL
jgi:hypothetical protein